MIKLDLRGMELADIASLAADMGEPDYRGRQVFRWVQAGGAVDFALMTDLPAGLRQQLAVQAEISDPQVLRQRRSASGDTTKFLLALPDGETVETVLMAYTGRDARDRYTACVSSQAGCAMGCRFCATGLAGWRRNLTAGEITGQVLTVRQRLQAELPGAEVTNVVFMGMGEPLLNYQEVVRAIRILHHPLGLNISFRRITVSTCGLAPGIRRLAGEGMPVVLAVSLHAPTDQLRDHLVPVNRRYPLTELLAACREYAQTSGRRVTFAYTLIDGVNDSRAQAHQLADLLRGMPANVNVVPLNTVQETGYSRPSPRRIQEFVTLLGELGVESVVREERGGDIEAACGQLRAGGAPMEMGEKQRWE